MEKRSVLIQNYNLSQVQNSNYQKGDSTNENKSLFQLKTQRSGNEQNLEYSVIQKTEQAGVRFDEE